MRGISRAGLGWAGLAALLAFAMAGVTMAQVAPPNGNPPGLRVQAPVSVDWALVNRDMTANANGAAVAQRTLAGRLPQLAETRIPVLTPNPASGLNLGGAVVMASANSYTINLPQPAKPGLSVVISGDSVFVAPPAGARLRLATRQVQIGNRPEDVVITQTETGQMASFTRYNVAYTVEIDCDTDASAAAWCNTDAFIRAVSGSLDGVVLGKTAQAQMQQAKQQQNLLTQASQALTKALNLKK